MKTFQKVVVVGGLVRPETLQRLRRGLSHLAVDWVSTRETDPSPADFTSQVTRPETCLIVVLLGVMRHSHSRCLGELAR